MALSSKTSGSRPAQRAASSAGAPPLQPAAARPAAEDLAPIPAPSFGTSVSSGDEPVADKAPARAAPGRSGKRGIWLLVVLLLLALGGALYYLARSGGDDAGSFAESVGIGLVRTREREAGWFGREEPAAAETNAVAAALLRPVHQAREVAGAVEAGRGEMAGELDWDAGGAGTAQAEPPPAAVQGAGLAAPQAASRVEQPVRQPAAPPAPAPPPAPPPAPVDVTPEPEPEPVVWPDVEVAAVVGGGRRGTALINGRVMVLGEESEEGLRLARIEPHAAVLRYKGELRRFIVRKR